MRRSGVVNVIGHAAESGEEQELENVPEDLVAGVEETPGQSAEPAATLFCELLELKPNKRRGLEPEWREIARWVKFEENVEEGGNRWSKPFVASLSLHSLVDCRSFLSVASTVLNSSAKSLEAVQKQIVDHWTADGMITADLRKPLLATLNQRIRHQMQPKPKISVVTGPGGEQQTSERTQKRSVSDFMRSTSTVLFPGLDPERNQMNSSPTVVTLQEILCAPDVPSGEQYKPNDNLLKKLPKGTQAASILCGEVDFLTKPLCAFVRLRNPIEMVNLTEVAVPTRFVFVLLGPKTAPLRYRQVGRTMGTLLSDAVFQAEAFKAESKDNILSAVDDFMGASTVLPPGEWNPEIRLEPPKKVQTNEARMKDRLIRQMTFDGGLDGENLKDDPSDSSHDAGIERTGRIFGGLVQDVKTKARYYWSDFRDALHLQCLASFIFLYVASLTPLITFGALMSDSLEKRMGAVETILARAASGVVWGLTAGQPVVILNSTGPILVFELIIFQLCNNFGLDYMSFRVWIGFWSAAQLLLMVAFDLSFLVKYITRFTEESFAALVSAIFVYEAIKKLIDINDKRPVKFNPFSALPPCSALENVPLSNLTKSAATAENTTAVACDPEKYVPDAFFLSVLLFLGTFALAQGFRLFKNTSYFPSRLRQFFSDFAVILSIIVFVGIDYAMGIPTPKLEVPDTIQPTFEGRNGSWIVPLFNGNPWWTALAGFIPGLLATILIFMDQQITCVIINRKENQLKKEKGYHLDLLIVAVLTAVLSLFGMPWMIADTVLSLTHVNSLKMESTVAAPGEKPAFLGVREQRVTNIAISIAIGVSVFMTSVLLLIPMPVLFGVFLFMGLNALNGLQFTDRVKLYFMPLKHQPDYTYLRHVKILRVHLFTFVQLICFAILWILKSFEESSIVFPLMVGALVGVRKLLGFVFTRKELSYLDDIMPETVKRKKDDFERRKSLAGVATLDDLTEESEPNGQHPLTELKSGVAKVRQRESTVSTPSVESGIVISTSSGMSGFTNAVNQTQIWRKISAVNSPPLTPTNPAGQQKAQRFFASSQVPPAGSAETQDADEVSTSRF